MATQRARRVASISGVRRFFGRGGALAKTHPSYEYRPGQIEMAEAVEQALDKRQHVIVEAGTGTGKTLAYLVPAILSGRRVVISTGTKNLQEQLFYKDVPFLQQFFDEPLRVCYMKGRSNYLCRKKLVDVEREPILDGLEEVADYQVIKAWEQTTETGDRAEVKTLPEKSTAWAKLDARRDTCLGQRCEHYERCFLTAMHQRAQESDVIIVNHHLLFADLAVKEEEFGGILPEYSAVVFDEAHEIEDVASEYFGLSVSNHQISELARDVSAVSRRKDFSSGELDRTLVRLQELGERFFSLFGTTEGRTGFRDQKQLMATHGEGYTDLLIALELTWTSLELIKSAPEEVMPLCRRAHEFHLALKFWMESGDNSFVYYVDRRNRTVIIQATPIDVSSLLAEKLFDRVDTVILTSATLSVAGSFEFVQQRLGVPAARTLCVPSQFDYHKQALLYVPQHMPDPRNPAYLKMAAEEIMRLLKASRGRAFVLFTAHQQMRQMYDLVAHRMKFPALLQGTKPRHALLEEFRTTSNAVLFATSSFWQGVDVPGDQLSCVIIDKLPFAVPSDPVVEARIRMIREAGGNPFYDYQIPQAAIALKQGFGRLIRARSDRGVLSLLDSRIISQRYGQVFFDSLPYSRFTMDIAEVERFFDV